MTAELLRIHHLSTPRPEARGLRHAAFAVSALEPTSQVAGGTSSDNNWGAKPCSKTDTSPARFTISSRP